MRYPSNRIVAGASPSNGRILIGTSAGEIRRVWTFLRGEIRRERSLLSALQHRHYHISQYTPFSIQIVLYTQSNAYCKIAYPLYTPDHRRIDHVVVSVFSSVKTENVDLIWLL